MLKKHTLGPGNPDCQHVGRDFLGHVLSLDTPVLVRVGEVML